MPSIVRRGRVPRAILQVPLLALALAAAAASARAQSDEETCFRSWDEDAVIRACSAVIGDQGRSPADLAKALNKRALSFGGKASHTSASYEDKKEWRAREMADYDEAIKLNPKWLYYHNRAEAKRQRGGNDQSALSDAEKAVELVKKERSVDAASHANVYETRGAIYLALGQKDKAADDFLTAYRINPGSEEARDGLKAVGVQPNWLIEWMKSFFVAE